MAINLGDRLVADAEASRAAHGVRDDMTQNVEYTIWSGIADRYVWPDKDGEVMHLVSDSVTDVGISVLIRALDSVGNEVNIVAVMNGTTPVPLPQELSRLNRVLIFDSMAPVGNVSVTNVAGTNTYAYLRIGTNASSQLVYTIPAGTRAVLLEAESTINKEGGSTRANSILRTYISQFGLIPWELGRWGMQVSGTSAFVFKSNDRPILQPRTDIEITVTPSESVTSVAGRLPFKLIGL